MDEDTCATNFMMRDARMAALVAPEKEPITPFTAKIRCSRGRVQGLCVSQCSWCAEGAMFGQSYGSLPQLHTTLSTLTTLTTHAVHTVLCAMLACHVS